MLDSFFASSSYVTPGAAVSASTARCMLVGPPQCGKTSMLFQLALNRASRGLSTLYIACGARDSVEMRPPVRPRLPGPSSDSPLHSTSGTAAGSSEDAMYRALSLIHIKYVSSWPELHEVLATLHLEEATPAAAQDLPRALLIDGLPSLFRNLVRGGGDGRGPALATAVSGPPHSTLPTPSPTKPEQQRLTMFLALALAVAAHAADYLDSPAAVARSPRPLPPDPVLLVVACSTPAPEVEMASRWLPTLLRVAPAAPSAAGGSTSGARGALFSLTQKQNGALGEEEESVCYRYAPGRTLELIGGDAASTAEEPRTPHAGRHAAGAGGSHAVCACASGGGSISGAARRGPVPFTPSSGRALVSGGGHPDVYFVT